MAALAEVDCTGVVDTEARAVEGMGDLVERKLEMASERQGLVRKMLGHGKT